MGLLASDQFYAKLSKCVFGVASVTYLGHIITAADVQPDSDKIKAVLDWPTPKSLTALRGFLGLTGFYRKFVQNYASLAAPLTDLLKQNNFTWSEKAHLAFTNLQLAMTKTPVLNLPDFTQTFNVETDASAIAVGAVLSQNGHPLAYFSKKMSTRMQHSSAYVREMFVVTKAVKKWRQYLIGRHFRILTDQQSLKHLTTQALHTPEQQKWATKLVGFQYEIKYRTGTSNRVADALSRCPDVNVLSFLSSPMPTLLDQFHRFYATSEGQALINKSLKPTVARIAASCYWPGLYKDTKHFIRHCTVCQYNKYVPAKKNGLLQPLSIPDKIWDDISMDFITHLPQCHGHIVIWVIVDRLSKYSHFIGLPSKFSAETLAHRFLTEFVRLHGVPRSIVLDRDRVFLNTFWKEFFRLLEYWYNINKHSSIGMSPFEAVYGRSPPALKSFFGATGMVSPVAQSLQNRTEILSTLKQNLVRAQQRMIAQTQSGRNDITFDIGDWFLLKLQPYRQLSLARRSSNKLSPRFFGPYKVNRRIGTVAYELSLPPTARIHPVFHVSLLRWFHGDPDAQFIPLPVTSENMERIYNIITETNEGETNTENETRNNNVDFFQGRDIEDAVRDEKSFDKTYSSLPKTLSEKSNMGDIQINHPAGHIVTKYNSSHVQKKKKPFPLPSQPSIPKNNPTGSASRPFISHSNCPSQQNNVSLSSWHSKRLNSLPINGHGRPNLAKRFPHSDLVSSQPFINCTPTNTASTCVQPGPLSSGHTDTFCPSLIQVSRPSLPACEPSSALDYSTVAHSYPAPQSRAVQKHS
ncbi:PREDICTED: uncharacterized protein LOC109332519 [Lupinus angustifolius]|uniref:uncharacterized protein LOC109332519 n=1 Tax=Lupinus angustifolius TaxID=3871 RepID=UPI00092FB7C7|nr:PREDICTED: uncharacterized protein LOC109332519 [Lupinus angustifolius]